MKPIIRVLLFVLFTATLACVFVFVLSEPLPHPTDKGLTDRFLTSEDRFDVLLNLCQEDSGFVRIADDFNWIESDIRYPRPSGEPDLSPERWGRYRGLFFDLGLSGGYFRRKDTNTGNDVMYFIASGLGNVGGSSTKGYAYSNSDLQPIYESLDEPDKLSGGGVGYKKLRNGWFIFLEKR